ncbi:MAG: hypothetical protein J6T23_02310 [Elusimicrobia bacterium]|nr:hypothetical protein [Elusimicrobiota bacterium]
MYGWIFYDVEIHDKKTDEFIKYENYTTLEEAKDYIKRMIETKSLDYNEKMLLIERNYDTNRDLIRETVIEEVDYEN